MSTEIEKAREWLRRHRDDCLDVDCAYCSDPQSDDDEWRDKFAEILAAYHASAEYPTGESPAPARTNPCPKCGSTLIHKDCRRHERRQGERRTPFTSLSPIVPGSQFDGRSGRDRRVKDRRKA